MFLTTECSSIARIHHSTRFGPNFREARYPMDFLPMSFWMKSKTNGLFGLVLWCSTNSLTITRLHFRPRTPPHDPSNLLYSSENIETEYDSEGNLIPVVTISSLKEYIDENSLNSLSYANGQHNEIDFESFNRHQEELVEMQKKQLERLRHNCQPDKGSAPDSGPVINKSGYNVCNCEHSSNPIITAPTTQSLSSGKPSVKRQSSAESSNWSAPALDSASAHFAVSVVRSASEVTHNRSHSTNANDVSKETIQNFNSFNCDNKSEKPVGAVGATNGPIAPTTHEKESLRKTLNSELCLPSTPSHTSITSNEEHDSNDTHDIHNTHPPVSATPCKLKFQNMGQKTASIHPTDVTWSSHV